MTKEEQLKRAPREKSVKKKGGLRRTQNKKKATKKRIKLMPISKLDSFVWKITSLAFRLQDSDERGFVKCCTCNKKMYYYKSDAQLGHFISRRAKWTKFERKNLSTQDTGCNKYGAGEQYKFSKFLDRVYGKGTADEMLTLSNKSDKFTRYDYKKVLLDNAHTLVNEAKKRKLYDWKEGLLKWELNFISNLNNYKLEEDFILNNMRV